MPVFAMCRPRVPSTSGCRCERSTPPWSWSAKFAPSKPLFMERLPFQVTLAAAPYESIASLPVSVLLDNVRSMYNVGAFFRTADAAGVEKLYLAGITACPPKNAIRKTALGAEERVTWEHAWDPLAFVQTLRSRGAEIAAIETTVHALDLFDWSPHFPVCLVFGHEVEGIRPELA